MEEQLPTPISELLILLLYLGSLTFLFATLIQYFLLKSIKSKLTLFLTLILSKFFSIILALIIWLFIFENIEVMLGPFLLPALLSEFFICSISIFFTKKCMQLK